MPPALRVPAAQGEHALRALLAAGLLEGAWRTRREGDALLIPVREAPGLAEHARALGGALVEAELPAREERLTPHEEVLARLPPELRALAPPKWERVGDVIVLRLPETLHARTIAAAYAEALHAKAVVRDASGVAGELREMRGELLHGEDAVTTHVENGVRYRLDAARIMFSSGNLEERARVIDAPGEVVADMFAGIGYFAIPLALRGRPARVVAMEKNPLSFRFLQENVALNGVQDVVEPWLGDNREHPTSGFADRVLMGYFPGTARYLPAALDLLKPEGGRVHYHDTAHERSWRDEMTRAFLEAARACGRVVAIEEARVVKGHSPGVVHAVLVARVRSA